MSLDISIEYNACSEEFTDKNVTQIVNGPLLVSYHTEKGKKLLDDCEVITLGIHQRTLIPNKLGQYVMKKLRSRSMSGTYGGFYWKNKSHTEHL